MLESIDQQRYTQDSQMMQTQTSAPLLEIGMQDPRTICCLLLLSGTVVIPLCHIVKVKCICIGQYQTQ